MADTQQGVRHQSARDAAGTTDTYDGDLRALFEAVATVPAGSTYNEAFMLWLQSVTGSSADNINDLAALHASQQDDTYNWSSGGPLLGGAPEFPPTLANLEFWFDAFDSSTITDVGGFASDWTDKSVNAFVASQATPSIRPAITTDGGLPSLLFDGGDALRVPSMTVAYTESTCFFVGRQVGVPTGIDEYLRGNDGTGITLRLQIPSVGNFRNDNPPSAGSAFRIDIANPKGTTRFAVVIRGTNGASGSLEFDDGTTGSDPVVGTMRTFAGETIIGAGAITGGAGVNAHIDELGFYSRNISDTEKTDLMDYLKSKWNL